MLGVDRLDYTKGIGHRLKAFGELLEEGRLTVEDVTLVQVASPSRERVQAYMQLRDEIELTVGRINGDFGTMSHTAISYHHHGYPREEMVALYLAADIMLVTALRDGMNLVAKEYVASRFDNDGVLILSEFTGASDELRRSLRINPHDIDGLKDAIVQAIGMPRVERQRRMRAMRNLVLRNNVDRWSAGFLAALKGVGEDNQSADAVADDEDPLGDLEWTIERNPPQVMPMTERGLPRELVGALREIARVKRLLVALDFDGTLAPEVDEPEQARAIPEARAAVLALLELPNTRVALVSGRSLASLEQVADLPDRRAAGRLARNRDPARPSRRHRQPRHVGAAPGRSVLNEVLGEVADSFDQVWLESKPAGFALHTRLATDHNSRVAHLVALSEATAEIDNLKVRHGKDVLEFSVRGDDEGRRDRAPSCLHLGRRGVLRGRRCDRRRRVRRAGPRRLRPQERHGRNPGGAPRRRAAAGRPGAGPARRVPRQHLPRAVARPSSSALCRNPVVE